MDAESRFKEVEGRYGAKAFRRIAKIMRCEADAEDVYQEWRIRIWTKIESGELKPRGKGETGFCYKTAIGTALNAARKRSRRGKLEREAGDFYSNSTFQNNPDERIFYRQIFEELNNLLKNLDRLERGVFLAYVRGGNDYAAIAELVNCLPNSARTLKGHAIRTLRKSLPPEMIEEL